MLCAAVVFAVSILFFFFFKIATNYVSFPTVCLWNTQKAQWNGKLKSLAQFLTHPPSKRGMLGVIFHFLCLFSYCLPHRALMWFLQNVSEGPVQSLKHSDTL